MKMLWIGLAASLASPLAAAQATIYKHVDESGRVTFLTLPTASCSKITVRPSGAVSASRLPDVS